MADETFTEKQVRLLLEWQVRSIADDLKKRMPAGVGFILFMADHGEATICNIAYLSTIQRQDVYAVLHEWLDKEHANHPAEGWETAALYHLELVKALGLAETATPDEVLSAIAALKVVAD